MIAEKAWFRRGGGAGASQRRCEQIVVKWTSSKLSKLQSSQVTKFPRYKFPVTKFPSYKVPSYQVPESQNSQWVHSYQGTKFQVTMFLGYNIHKFQNPKSRDKIPNGNKILNFIYTQSYMFVCFQKVPCWIVPLSQHFLATKITIEYFVNKNVIYYEVWLS